MPPRNPRAVLERPLTPDTLLTVSEACVALAVPEARVPAYRLWLERIVRRVGPDALQRVRWGDVIDLDAGEPAATPKALDGWTRGAGLRHAR